ncbi:hypothetical protein ACFV9W_08535 [Streptomyces sp. NPDC059897]|uniref:hypothetical protein n=1 Tax=Streptomyces sp. NPDC059897 TaxID=3346994 RepID=UPI00365B0593
MLLGFLVYVVVFLGSLVGACALLGYGCGQLSGKRDALRGAAALAGAVAAALYAWGLLGVAGAVLTAEDGGTGSSPVIPCRTGDMGRDAHIVDYTVRYVPLGFVCETSDGRGSYATDDVPGYVNPGAALFGLSAVVGAVGVGYRGELRARRA